MSVSNRPAGEMEGQLTYDAEGNDNPDSQYFSCKPHVPGSWSGLTIGRGYDMKLKSAAKITEDLIQAGVDRQLAEKFAGASGKSGDDATQYLAEQDLHEVTITLAQQEKLFAISYAEIKRDVKRLCEKPDVVAAYGAADIDAMHYAIRDVTIDLRFRGDYTPASRKLIQRHIANNDLAAFKSVLCDRAKWSQVPQDRFDRRCQYLTNVQQRRSLAVRSRLACFIVLWLWHSVSVADEPVCPSAKNQQQMTDCLVNLLQQEERKLRQLVDQLTLSAQAEDDSLNWSAPYKKARLLVASQSAWWKFRDLACQYESFEALSGRAYGDYLSRCQLRYTQKRYADLYWFWQNPQYLGREAPKNCFFARCFLA